MHRHIHTHRHIEMHTTHRHIHVHVQTVIHVTHTHTQTHTHTHTDTHTHRRTHTQTHTHTHYHRHAHIHVDIRKNILSHSYLDSLNGIYDCKFNFPWVHIQPLIGSVVMAYKGPLRCLWKNGNKHTYMYEQTLLSSYIVTR